MNEYRKLNKEVRKLLRKAKDEWAEQQARLVESSFEKKTPERRTKQSRI